MSLDPAASPWPGVVASVGVCVYIAAIGAPITYAVFRDRPRMVWPYYAPMVGVVAVLLTTNLVAYVIPGAPGTWVGLLGTSAVVAVIAQRTKFLTGLSVRSAITLLAIALPGISVFLLAYANRVHTFNPDAAWHHALTLQLARGVFPPVTPFGVDASPFYHYGHNLLAASIVNAVGAPVWSAFDALGSFLIAVLVLAVIGLAIDAGAPVLLAIGLGAAAGFFSNALRLGFDAGPVGRSAPGHAFQWIDQLQWSLALGCVVLVAAALQAGVTRRHAALLAASTGVFALAEAAVMIFSCAALALVGTSRLLSLRWPERLNLSIALVLGALLVMFAGGPVSDVLFSRGGSTDTLSLAWEPVASEFAPVRRVGPALVNIGILPLAAIGAFAAYRRRNWGVGFLIAAGVLGLLESQLLQVRPSVNENRIFNLALFVAMLGALTGLGALVGELPNKLGRGLATTSILVLILIPTSLPRAVSGAQLALKDLRTVDPAADASGHHFRDRAYFGSEIAANWEFYDWLRRSMPHDARLLSPRALLTAAVAGVASPRSGRDMQAFSLWFSTWVYADALRFMHHADLSDMGITHLHVTDQSAARLVPSALRLLDDPNHFRLLYDMETTSGTRHRVFQVVPGAGTTRVAPSSFRALRKQVPLDASVSVLGSLTSEQSNFILSAFAKHAALADSYGRGFDRASVIPRVEDLTERPKSGAVVLRDLLEPTELGVSRAEALWVGEAMRAYDLGGSWSNVWRIGGDSAQLPASPQRRCESATDGKVDLHLLGEPGRSLSVGTVDVTLTGLPQRITLSISDCSQLRLRSNAELAPFVQLRPHYAAGSADANVPIAGLAFDSGIDGARAILNFWYRNPEEIQFLTGTSFRLYEGETSGVGFVADNPDPRTSAVRWWSSPIILRSPEQTARVEFDARQLTINGDPGAGSASNLIPDQVYLLALTVSGSHARETWEEIQHIIPVARVSWSETGIDYEVFSGIVTIEHRAPGTPKP